MTLYELYNVKLMEYKKYGVKDEPDKLLSMLLLPKKEDFEPLMVSEGKFYEKYKKKIDYMIEKVINDFDITDEEIIHHVEKKGVLCNNFEHDKIWFVFCEGFGLMHWSIMYHKEKTPEEIYIEEYGASELTSDENLENVKILRKQQKEINN